MFIAAFVGMLSGLVGVLCWLVIQLFLNMPGVYGKLSGSWYLFPPMLGVGAAALHWVARAFSPRRRGEMVARRQALSDVFESYHFGIFVLHPLDWVARGLVTLVNAFLGGTFGLEGGVLELTYATLPPVSKYFRLFIEEKQLFVICALSASMSVALGAPFSGALIAIEMVHVLNAKVRRGAVVASLIAYGTAMLFQGTFLSGLFVESTPERLNVLGSVFAGLRPMNMEFFQWALLSVAAAGVGVAAAFLSSATSWALGRGSAFASDVASRHRSLVMVATGVLMSVAVWFVPSSFSEPWRSWEDLAWMRISTPHAIMSLASEWTLLVLAFAGWGSSGLFSPMLFLGALLGYSMGNLVGSTWALPLAISGAAAMLGVTFRVPIAAAALVLEIGHDGPMWWLSTIAVASAIFTARFLKIRPLYEILLDRHGLRVVGGRAASLLASLKASDAMEPNVRTIRENSGFQEMRAAASAVHHNFIGVVTTDERYLGLLALEQLPLRVRRAISPEANPADILAVERVVEIRDLIDTLNPTLSPDDSLEKALRLLQDTLCVAVVDNDRKLRGLLFESAIVGLYKREIARSGIKLID